MNVLFWDIDGTLMKTAKAGLYAFQQASYDLFGVTADFGPIETAGMTDCYISAQIIRQVTKEEPEVHKVKEMVERYEELLCSHLTARAGEVMPNVEAILAHFHAKDDFVSLLLTGNTTAGARAKLRRYNLDQYFDFDASGFGDNCQNRTALAHQALANARKHYAVDSSQIFVIGDTPNDIACGKAIDAYTVAIATGIYPLDELINHSPWWAVPQLPAPHEFEAKLKSTCAG